MLGENVLVEKNFLAVPFYLESPDLLVMFYLISKCTKNYCSKLSISSIIAHRRVTFRGLGNCTRPNLPNT